ncbi:pyridoxamine 5'-phosphate oxidase family protein [Streptacidiphilus sp. ASG 303]|uniref:pyridoxamine 5'-phosphate oxidase family protein n=1 Tax=Streptacidiphilus sp. ASG 303 TaxID=2896847 RepID=UPI001E3E54A0|nr:pyridoxamine 5'-phosphate oxidase family protein [Streptacidiphilus sp. ASG 303]MCD0484813.1 pyridoxamine 5'-phosphate oxidase family protein [Streptacidiphilus sp. ASG 303]
MPQHYARIAFTDEVRQVQQAHGSRTAMQRFEEADFGNDVLGPEEAQFAAERDGFYLATTSSTGWPYVQYRGGPPGFLHVLDETTLAWAELRGNRQYISQGNLAADSRASLFLMDYAHRQRLKIFGSIRFLDPGEHPDLAARLTPADTRSVVQRLSLVHLHAYDWNCPQHITPRYTAAQLQQTLDPVREELARLRSENQALRARLAARSADLRDTGVNPGH